ncbi:hypothetical protein BP00DRAFT_495699 [Aspergillus indologenus CBS 114.80]|uniref:Carboxymuconolactone decarboxylase-like domain-containing protein n=1 Tax=Aspergillus indologenus CBS 114.80 TaxID=1450541 RepID=A0A2V5I3M1_9EURO|nr:hypothetical protein BP00DRAFT_495699 [Aspergillus indologenus CBS 114.80]
MASEPNNDPHRKTCLIPYVDPNTAPSDIQERLKVLPFRRNILLVLAHSQGLFPHISGLLGACFDGKQRKLSLFDWQVVVLRVAHSLDAKYVWDVNIPVAEAFGFPPEKAEAMGCSAQDVVEGKGPWSARERVILRLVDEQVKGTTNEPDTVKAALQHLDVDEVVEVLVMTGIYVMLAGVMRGLKIDDDEFIPDFQEKIRDDRPVADSTYNSSPRQLPHTLNLGPSTTQFSPSATTSPPRATSHPKTMATKTPSTTTRITHLLTHWPKDKVRPASVSIHNYLQSRLPQPQPQPQPSSPAAQTQTTTKTGLSAANLDALTALLNDKFARRYPLPPRLRHPASNPQHYENVIREFDEAPDRDWLGRLRKKVAGMLRLK